MDLVSWFRLALRAQWPGALRVPPDSEPMYGAWLIPETTPRVETTSQTQAVLEVTAGIPSGPFETLLVWLPVSHFELGEGRNLKSGVATIPPPLSTWDFKDLSLMKKLCAQLRPIFKLFL